MTFKAAVFTYTDLVLLNKRKGIAQQNISKGLEGKTALHRFHLSVLEWGFTPSPYRCTLMQTTH